MKETHEGAPRSVGLFLAEEWPLLCSLYFVVTGCNLDVASVSNENATCSVLHIQLSFLNLVVVRARKAIKIKLLYSQVK